MPSTPGSICLVTPELLGLTADGGIGVSIRLLAELLAEHGWRVHVLHCGSGTAPEALQLVHQQLGRAGIGFTHLDDLPVPEPLRVKAIFPSVESIDRSDRAQWAVAELHDKESFDLVQFPDWQGLGFRAIQARRSRLVLDGVGTIVKLHGMNQWVREHNQHWPYGTDELVLDFAEQRSFELADFQLAASRYVRDYARGIGWNVRPDAEVVPNPLGEPRFREHWRADDTPPELVFFGRLEVHKGLKVFVEALDRIEPALEITFLGRDTLLEGRRASQWVQGQLKNRNIRFLTDCDREQALTYLSSGNRLAIIPSMSETYCHTVAECLVNGIPFLAARAGAIPELVCDAELQGHLLFDPSAPDLRRCLAAYLDAEPIQRHAWREMILDSVDVAAHNRHIIDYYERCLWNHRRVAGANPSADLAVFPPPPLRCWPSSSQNQPLVTVAVTHHNLGASLPETLASVAAQTYPNLEVLVIDDGSTDASSVQVFNEQSRRYPKFVFLRQSNAGVAAARNRVLAEANGEFYLPLDADDIAVPQMVEHLVAALQANPACSAMSSFMLAFEQETDSGERRLTWAYRATGGPLALGSICNVYGHCSGLFRTRHLRDVGGYDPARGIILEDWHLYVKLACSAHEVGVLPEHLLYNRIRPDSTLRSVHNFAGHLRIVNEYATARELPRSAPITVWTALLGCRQQLLGTLHQLHERQAQLDVAHAHVEEMQAQLRAAHAHVASLADQMACVRYRLVDSANTLLKRIPSLHALRKKLALFGIGLRKKLHGGRRLPGPCSAPPPHGDPVTERRGEVGPSRQMILRPIDLAAWTLEAAGHRVVSGPFQGMQYIRHSHGTVLVPKVLGIYERELHPFLERIIRADYECVLNIGSAEGYYAVGLARAMPGVLVYAYDTNPEARLSLEELARLNGVSGRIAVRAHCDHAELNGFAGRRALVVCDIEGCEEWLLDPEQDPVLHGFELLVELHDRDQSRRIRDLMISRFHQSHTLEFVRYGGRTLEDCAALFSAGTLESRLSLIDEGRRLGLEWVFITRRAQCGRQAA
jgi:glycosyltransferase involved in cell wall biosynthesis/GT2 family glycosyltransferase